MLRGYYGLSYSTETLAEDLEIVTSAELEWEIYLERYQKEYKKKYGDKEAVEITEELYLNNLDEIRKHGGYNSPPTKLSDEMSVYDYCMGLKKLKAHNERLLADQQARKNAR